MSGKLITDLHTSIADIPPDEWNRCASTANPFLSHAFLSALEDSGSAGPDTGWLPQHLAIRDEQHRLQAVAPMYGKSHSYGEYVFDQGWARALEQAGGRYYPKLQVAVPFTPATGPRLLRAPGALVRIGDLANLLEQVCKTLKLSSVHITFCEPEEWEALGSVGWLQRSGVQFHWQNQGYCSFDDFLDVLQSRKRKMVRRERREANGAGLQFHTLRGDEIQTQHWDAFYEFYLSTIDRKWGSAYLTRSFFTLLSERLGQAVVLMLAYSASKPVAGALNLVGGDTLYGRNWGLVGEWPFLHFELCYYRAIDFAIAHGLRRVEAGAQGEHKLQRGYLPTTTYSAHWIAHTGLRRAVAAFVDQERAMQMAEVAALGALSPFRATLNQIGPVTA